VTPVQAALDEKKLKQFGTHDFSKPSAGADHHHHHHNPPKVKESKDDHIFDDLVLAAKKKKKQTKIAPRKSV
jgi:hypothetical protein